MIWLLALLLIPALGLACVYVLARQRNVDRWLLPLIKQRLTHPAISSNGEKHILICFADHYEPRAQGADRAQGLRRVQRWHAEFPRQFARFLDSDGRPPRWSYFFPEEEYEPEYLDLLSDLCRQGLGEVEIHLHHDRDTPAGFQEKLTRFRDLLAQRHGLLSRHKITGELAYSFIHGNWALCNSRRDGLLCGVDQELGILKATGCYADLTYPSAPDGTQPPIVNTIYYAWDRPGTRASHHHGLRIGQGKPPDDALMLIQGPLMLDWGNCKWGFLPRLENGCLQGSQPPALRRLSTWMRAGVTVPGRPDWTFIKLHAHGAPENSHEALLGEPMVRFHEELAKRMREDPRFHVHYVSAREMYNLAKAAEAGFQGPVADALDFELVSNVALSPAASVALDS